ncbi:hypothetical protein D8B22_16345 [Verminephrobacter aporrectodeae subsp. tuberculatae]|nr:hypothetical protein [Verminephrobacter aporrectodeae subsp. tuberculatae]
MNEVRDLHGNPGTDLDGGNIPVNSGGYSVSTLGPSLAAEAITFHERVLTGHQRTTTVTLSFSEPVKGLSSANLHLSTGKGTLSAPVARDPDANGHSTVWTTTLTAPAAGTNNSQNNKVTVDLTGVSDRDDLQATTNRVESRDTYAIDSNRPHVAGLHTVRVWADKYTLGPGESTRVHFEFNETPYVIPREGNLVGLSGRPGSLESMPGTQWDEDMSKDPHNPKHFWMTLRAKDGVEGASGRVTMDLGKTHDANESFGTGTYSSPLFTIDTVRPRVLRITIDDTHLRAGETAQVTFVFNERVNGPSVRSAIDLPNAHGRVGELYSTDGGETWVATFIPAANTANAHAWISLNMGRVYDLFGNTGEGNPVYSNGYTVSTLGPSLAADAITFSESAFTLNKQTMTVTLTFSEPVKGLSSTNLRAPEGAGTLSAPLARNADANGYSSVWTATVTAPTGAMNNSENHKITADLVGVTDRDGLSAAGRVESSNTYAIDVQRPSIVEITMSDTTLGIGEVATATIRFAERVRDFTLADLRVYSGSMLSGTLSDLLSTDGGQTWTVKLTPTGYSNSHGSHGRQLGDNMIVVRQNSVVDWMGNSGPADDKYGPSYTVDHAAPVLTGAGSIAYVQGETDSSLDAGETATVTFIFSEAVRGFDTRCILPYVSVGSTKTLLGAAGGTLSNLVAFNGGTTWTATLTAPTGSSTLSNVKLGVDMSRVSDESGNVGSQIHASGISYHIDTTVSRTRPSATVALADSVLTADESSTVTITFSERVTGLDTTDVDLAHANGTLGALSTADDGITWTASFTPQVDTEDASNTIGVNLAGVTNGAGRTGAGNAISPNYAVNTVRPSATVHITDPALTPGETSTVTFQFSEPVTGFGLEDVIHDDPAGTLSPPRASADGRTWTSTLTPHADTHDLSNEISVRLSGVTNAAGNTGLGSTAPSPYAVDTQLPRATITLANTALKAGETTLVTFAFNRAVTGFDAADIDLSNANGTLGNLTNLGHSTLWTATFTPTASLMDASNSIRVHLAGVQATGPRTIGQGQASSANYTIDTQRPTATITLADTTLSADETTTVTFRFNEPVSGFTRDDIVLTDANGTLGDPTTDDDGRTWTATFTPTTAHVNDTNNTIRVNLPGVTNAAGNAGTGSTSSASYTVDTRPATDTEDSLRPRLAATNPITINDSKLGIGESTTVSIRFSKAIAADSFHIDDLSAGGSAKLSNLHSTDGGTTWEVTLTAPGPDDFASTPHYDVTRYNSTGNQIRVNLAGVTDLTDNAGVGQAVSTVTYDIDVLPPRCTIRLADSTLSAGDTTTVSFSFNEPVTGLDARDIDLSNANGTLGPLTALADGRTWSAPFTPSANINDASNTIRLAMRGVADLAGNPAQNGTAVSSNYRIDTRPGTADQAPDLSATVTLTDEHLTAGETATVIMAFNQPVPGLTINDIDLTQANGTLSEPALSADGRTWTATFTPTANVNAASNTIRVNLAGLTGSATSANFSVHTAPSAATITLADTVLTTGHTTTVTFTFTQTVLGFTVDDIDLTQANGTLGPLTTVNNKTWTATFTPKAAVNDAANHISVNLAGVSTVDGRSGTGSVSSDNYAVNTQLPDTTRPALSTATVNGNQLVLTYTEENTLSDATLTGSAGFTVTNAAGTTITVTSAVVNAAAKTITLTLGHAVAHGEDVAISYTQPEGAGGVADAAGNSAANFPDMRVTNTTPAPADTTPPQLITSGDTTPPRVNGDQLVLSFDDSSDLDPEHKPANEAFAVLVDGVANAVTNVTVDGQTKTITLTLSTAVTSGQPVTVAYADATSDNDSNAIQDAAGNDAAHFAATEVINNTPAPADTTPPQLITSGDTTRPRVNGDQLVLSFDDSSDLDADADHKPANEAFAVLVDGVLNAVTSVTVEAQAKTVTLTLSTAVTSGQTVTVAYADATSDNDSSAIQDAAGNDAAHFAATEVLNNTPAPADTTPPQLITSGTAGPRTLGSDLVLEFSDASNLDATEAHKPLSGDFTVLVDGAANAVTSVIVGANSKLVYLTLSTPVRHAQSVRIAYNDSTPDDTSAIRDTAGNRLTSFPSTAVNNRVPDRENPQLITTGETTRPRVNGDQLVLSFGNTDNLDADPIYQPESEAFAVLVDGAENAVTNVTVDARANTITLTLTMAVSHGQTVTVAYADPTTGNDANAIQDTAGNDAAHFAATAVVNNTPAPDTTPPECSSAAVHGDQLVLTYIEANTLSGAALTGNAGFTVSSTADTDIPVSSAVVDATAKTVTLTLSRAVTSAETVTVSYTKPETGGVQDAAGNDAADLSSQAVTNNTPAPADTTPPECSSAAVHGDQLVLTYTEANTLNGATFAGNAGFTVSSTADTDITVSSAVVDATAKTVTLTLSRAVSSAETVTVSYTKPETGGVQDAAGNDAADLSSQAVTNNTPAPADATPPQLITSGETTRPRVNGDQLVLSFDDSSDLDADPIYKPANEAFTVLVNGVANAVTNVTVEARAKTVTLTLSTAVSHGQTVTVAYADPTTDNDANAIQDAAGNDAAHFAATEVVNNTPAPADTTLPQLITSGETTRPRVNGDQLVLSFDDSSDLDADPIYKPANEAFTVLVNGVANAVTEVSVNAQTKTVTLTLSTVVTHGQSVTVAYTGLSPDSNDANAIQDAAGNDAPSFAATAVLNNTPAPADTMSSVIRTATVDSAIAADNRTSAPLTNKDTRDNTNSDGNGDGIPDSTQAAVASTRPVLSPTGASQPADAASPPVTLVAGSQDGKLDPDSSGARVTRLEQEDAPAQLPQGMEMPLGLLSFETTRATGRSSEPFSLYVDAALGTNGYWVQDSTGSWINLSSAPYGGKVVSERGRLRLDFEIADGGQFDADGQANGVITAPGATARMQLSVVGQTSDAAGGSWF